MIPHLTSSFGTRLAKSFSRLLSKFVGPKFPRWFLQPLLLGSRASAACQWWEIRSCKAGLTRCGSWKAEEIGRMPNSQLTVLDSHQGAAKQAASIRSCKACRLILDFCLWIPRRRCAWRDHWHFKSKMPCYSMTKVLIKKKAPPWPLDYCQSVYFRRPPDYFAVSPFGSPFAAEARLDAHGWHPQ